MLATNIRYDEVAHRIGSVPSPLVLHPAGPHLDLHVALGRWTCADVLHCLFCKINCKICAILKAWGVRRPMRLGGAMTLERKCATQSVLECAQFFHPFFLDNGKSFTQNFTKIHLSTGWYQQCNEERWKPNLSSLRNQMKLDVDMLPPGLIL